MRLVETSNTALLMDDGRVDATAVPHSGSSVVRGQVTRHYEMVRPQWSTQSHALTPSAAICMPLLSHAMHHAD